MAYSFLKPYLPRSLFARALLIVMIPLLALQLVVAVTFVQRHYEDVTRQMTQNIAREIAVAQLVIDTSPSADIAQLRLNGLSRPLDFVLDLDAGSAPMPGNRRLWYDLSGRALTDEMRMLLGDGISVDLIADRKMVDVRLPTDKGTLRALIPRARVTVSNPHQLLVLTGVTTLLLALLALLFLRNQLRPIARLAQAAEAFGKGRSVPFRAGGADEVRRAGNAFLAMRGRLERQIEQRTQMLSGVSHDLRTPLTRMKLTLALADDLPEADDLKRDVVEMEQMLNAFLDFARGDQMEEMTETDLVALAEDLAAKARRGGIAIETDIQVEDRDACNMMIRAGAVTRAVDNLIGNAGRYGGRVLMTLRLNATSAVFGIEDDGPGIPADQREHVMRPFTRLDAARNQDKGGGVGLGLSIAQDVARSHGGALELDESPHLGGLRATLRLPR